jgi:predicted transcriptional regulator
MKNLYKKFAYINKKCYLCTQIKLIININAINNMYANIDKTNTNNVFYNKEDYVHYEGNNVIAVNVKGSENTDVRTVCDIISKLNDFTQAESDVFYTINVFTDVNVTQIYDNIKQYYGYHAMTIRRAIDNFIKKGIVKTVSYDDKKNYKLVLNDSYNVKDSIANTDGKFIIAVSLYNI